MNLTYLIAFLSVVALAVGLPALGVVTNYIGSLFIGLVVGIIILVVVNQTRKK